ncbi:MAG TPA: TolC family protein [Thermoanaerobaculia bacterium]|nr:TolC family protein [Thermoanaerobaculia bacterium]
MMRSSFLLALLLASGPVRGQEASASSPPQESVRSVCLHEFLEEIRGTNLDLAATRFNVTIAEAQIAIAKVFPDPALTVGPSALNNPGAPQSVTVGLSQTIELGGKRGSRVDEAKRGRSLAEAQLEDFFQTLRVNATNAFIDALAARQVLDRKRRTLASVERLVGATEQRLRAGDIGPAALWQVKVEAERFRSDVITAEGDVRAADYALDLFVSPRNAASPVRLEPAGALLLAPRAFDAEPLVANAVAQRSDLLVALRSEDVATAHVGVAKSNRWIDLTLGADWTRTSAASGDFATIAPSPAFDSLGFSVGLPIPFSRLLHGELEAAEATSRQAEMQSLSARRRVQVEVRQALARYDATRRALDVYTGEVLGNADKSFEATRYSYERGAARLLELIDAQRTVDDVYLSYVSALTAHAKALVALERASAQWDIDF